MTLVNSPAPIRTTELSNSSTPAERLANGITALASGHAIVLCDNVVRPEWAELVYLAERADVPTTAFVIRHSSGFLQVALPADRCDELGLSAQCGSSPSGIPQCVSVDSSAGIGTGISATDRAATIRLLASSSSAPQSFTRPGHVVPVRVDAGQHSDDKCASASLLLASLAGASPAAVLATLEGISDSTRAAEGPEVARFAREYGLCLVALSDLPRSADTAQRLSDGLGVLVGRLQTWLSRNRPTVGYRTPKLPVSEGKTVEMVRPQRRSVR